MDYSMARSSSSSVDNKDGSPVTKDYIQTVLREYEQNDTLIVKNMSSEKALSFGENYIAEVFRIKIDGEITKDGKVTEISKSVIVKKPYLDEKSSPPEMFKFESKVYSKVLDAFENELKQQLPVIRSIKAEENIVVTEDFKDGGWVLPKHREGLNEEQSVKVAKSLARFHAASIILAKNNETSFKNLSQYVQDQNYSESNAAFCKETLAESYAVAKYFADKYLPKANEDEAALIKKLLSLTSDDMYNKAKKATAETPKFAALFVHGNCWSNNFMLKENNSGDHALLINLATVCLASPARDLIYLVATNPQKVDEKPLLEAYIKELHKYLGEHKVPSDIINKFNMEFIESEMKRLKPVALVISIWLLKPISYNSNPSIEEYSKLERNDQLQFVAKHIDSEFYVRRLLKVLRDYA